VIELRDVVKIYSTRLGPNVVLRGANAVFPPQTNVGIVGRNGAGKSTLLRLLGGVEHPDSGEVVREGRVSWPIGFGGGFHGSLTAEENCRFVARIYGEDVDRVTAFAKDFAELGAYFGEPMRTFSSGMRSRLAFGLSMAIDFDYYLVDEVTAVGDARFNAKCRQAFLERQARSSLIMVSHQLKTVQSYCTQVAVLSGGDLTFYPSVKEAAKAYQL
jgi:capsular polysaccharide transport system ATP-binding protein